MVLPVLTLVPLAEGGTVGFESVGCAPRYLSTRERGCEVLIPLGPSVLFSVATRDGQHCSIHATARHSAQLCQYFLDHLAHPYYSTASRFHNNCPTMDKPKGSYFWQFLLPFLTFPAVKLPPKHHNPPVTCFYWFTRGYCIKSDENCAYAHYNTGYYASDPTASYQQRHRKLFIHALLSVDADEFTSIHHSAQRHSTYPAIRTTHDVLFRYIFRQACPSSKGD